MMSRIIHGGYRETIVKHFQKKSGIIPYAVVAAVAFLVYANAIGGGFVFDDNHLGLGDMEIYGPSKIGGHLAGVEGYHKTMGRYYRPLVSLTFIADAAFGEAFFNDPADPRPYHTTNIIIHAAASVIVLRLLVLLFRNRSVAVAAALVFAVHPVHTEAVSWISGRTDGLAGMFYAWAFLFWIRYAAAGGAWRLAGLFACFAAALGSKEMAVTFPAAVLLYDYTLGRANAATFSKRLPLYAALAAIAVAFLLWREHVLSGIPEREAYLYFHGKDWVATAATMLQTLPEYARLLFMPTRLLYHYDGVLPMQDSFLAGGVILSTVFVLGTLGAAWFLRRRAPVVTFCILFFYVTLLPVMNIVPTQSLMAERFLYIPSLLVAVLIADALSAARLQRTRYFLLGAAGILILIFGFMTFERNKDWETDETLYRSAEGTPGTTLNVNLGNLIARKGNLDRAETLYREALQIDPEEVGVLVNLGALYFNRGFSCEKAAAVRRSNDDEAAARRLEEEARGYYETAAGFLEKAYALDPLKESVLYTMAALCDKRGMPDEAIRYLEELQEVSPNFGNSRALLKKLKEQKQP